MFGNTGIFGENLLAGRVQSAELDAFSTNRKLAASRRNSEEWKSYSEDLEDTLKSTRLNFVENGLSVMAGLRSTEIGRASCRERVLVQV